MSPTFILDPNIVYLVLLLGLWSCITAVYVPGTGVVEVLSALISIGAIVMLAALPTNWLAVVGIILGGAAFLFLPFFDKRFSILAIGGLALQAVSSYFLYNGTYNDVNISVSLPLIGVMIVLSLAYHQFILMPVLERTRKRSFMNDDETLIGVHGRVLTPIDGENLGTVRAASETWTARSNEPLTVGDDVTIIGREGLTLVVQKLEGHN